jgi:hypothetical protein
VQRKQLVAGDDGDWFAGLHLLGFAEGDEVAEASANELDFILIRFLVDLALALLDKP